MHRRSPSLMLTRRFLPVFLVQFLGALTDNLFRNAIFVLVTFRLAESRGINAPVIVSLGAGLFILPFFLFSATAGSVVDRFEKTCLIQRLKFIELIFVGCAGLSLALEQVPFMLTCLFLLGLQAAFFGPIKYSILPQLVGEVELVAANGYVEGGTFFAILLGTIAGGLTVTLNHGMLIVALVMGILSLIGWLISYMIPPTTAGDATLKISWRFLSATWPLLRDAYQNRPVWRSILGISWFWFIGAIFLSVLPNYVKDILGGNSELVTFLLALFSVGIAVGSIWCNYLLKGRVDARFVPIGALCMGIATFAVFWLSTLFSKVQGILTIATFIATKEGASICLALFLLATAGGIFTVPLYSIMQAGTERSHRARTIAANNIINALFMVVSSGFTLAMFTLGYKVTDIFLILSLVSFVVALYVSRSSLTLEEHQKK